MRLKKSKHQKPGMAAAAYNPTLGKQRLQEHPRLKAYIFYRMNSRLAWATSKTLSQRQKQTTVKLKLTLMCFLTI